MAAVYKSLSKPNGKVAEKDGAASDGPKNRQRVLILSSRGVTMRYARPTHLALHLPPDTSYLVTDISSTISTLSFLTVARTQSSTPRANSTSSMNSPISTTATMSSSSRRAKARISTSG